MQFGLDFGLVEELVAGVERSAEGRSVVRL